MRRSRGRGPVAVRAWCPRCSSIVGMRFVPSTATAVCPSCGGSYTISDLQEAAYAEGFTDGLARVARRASRRAGQ